MNKTEIQSRIEKCESELATLKADLAKCDCADGIEQEKCWHRLVNSISVWSVNPETKSEVDLFCKDRAGRSAYMPECRQVTAEDVALIPCFIPTLHEEMARELHKRGFRMKVTP